jgi:hypothetical protein
MSMEPTPSARPNVALAAAIMAAFYSAVYTFVIVVITVTAGVLPGYLDTAWTLGVVPFGSAFFGVLAMGFGRVDERLGLPYPTTSTGLLLGGIAAWLFVGTWLDYLRVDADLLWRGRGPPGPDAAALAWVDVAPVDARWEEAGHVMHRLGGKGSSCDEVRVAVPIARAGEREIWGCQIDRCTREVDAYIADVRDAVTAWPGGGPVVRASTEVDACAAAAARSSKPPANDALFLEIGISHGARMARLPVRLGWFVVLTWVVWVGVPIGFLFRGQRASKAG